MNQTSLKLEKKPFKNSRVKSQPPSNPLYNPPSNPLSNCTKTHILPSQASQIHIPPLHSSPPSKSNYLHNSVKISKLSFNSKDSTVHLPLIINDKFFQIKHKITTLDKQGKRNKHKGKSVYWQQLNNIVEKEATLLKLEAHSHLSPLAKSFHPESFVKEYFLKFNDKMNEIKKATTLQENLTEDAFLALIDQFYNKKIVKSECLMKYLKGKDAESIWNKMGKFLYNFMFGSNQIKKNAFSYLEISHRNIGISNEDYDTYKGLFMINLRENGFTEKEVQVYVSILEKFRGIIVKKLTFEEITCNKSQKFDEYLLKLHENIKENGLLSHFFSEIEQEAVCFHQKMMFNFVCQGYNQDIMVKKKEISQREFHQKAEVSWRECFEMKNQIINNLLDRKTLFFSQKFECFRNNLQRFHKFFLVEPNFYAPNYETSIDFQVFIDSLKKNKRMNQIFANFSNERLQTHCKYLLNFLMNSPKNPYSLSDLIPAHCKAFITNQDFLEFYTIFSSILSQISWKNDEKLQLQSNFRMVQGYISREKSIFHKYGGLSMVNSLIENIYISIFGSTETKELFVNADMDYTKYKQKLFFIRLLKNEIDGVDIVDLKAIHMKVGVEDKHFDAFVKFAAESLVLMMVEPACLKGIIEKIQFLRPAICQKKEI